MNKRLGRFEIVEPIRTDGKSHVYRAIEYLTDRITRPAAVKVLPGLKLDDDARREILRREVEVLAELSACPNIVTIYGCGVDENVGPWMAMELAGRNLREFMGDGPAEPDQVRLLLRDTLRALAIVHGADPPILHRDLKPTNILRSKYGTWQIADFGLAQRGESDETLDLMTVQYAAPEMLDGTLGPESPQMDLYSLGLAAYQFALGRTLFRKQFPSVYDPDTDPSDSVADERPKWMYWHTSMQMAVPPLADVIGDYPEDLSALVTAMTAKPLSDRLASAEDALERLGNVSAEAGPPEDIAVEIPSEERPVSARTVALGAVTLALILAVGAFGILQLMDSTKITLVGDGVYSGNTPEISVTGRIESLPKGGAASLLLSNGMTFLVAVDDNGRFNTKVTVPRIGTAEALITVSNAAGKTIASTRVRLDRSLPETVDVVINTQPAVREAKVVLNPLGRGADVKLRTGDDGVASSPLTYGTFSLQVTHPRYKPVSWTGDTGYAPVRTLKAELQPLPESVLSAKRDRILGEMAALGDAAASGDPAALARLKQLQKQLAMLAPPATQSEAARRKIVSEMEALRDAAANGDPEAIAKLKQLQEQLDVLDAAGPDTDDDEALDGANPDDPDAAKRAALLEELTDVAAKAAEGDPTAIARLKEIHRELQELAPPLDGVAGGNVVSGGTSSSNQVTLSQLSLGQLKVFVERNLPTGALEIDTIPQVNKVRIKGPVFDKAELALLIERMALAAPRLQVEIRIDPWAVSRRLEHDLKTRGIANARVQAFLATGENVMFVLFEPTAEFDVGAVETIARNYVLDPDLLFLGPDPDAATRAAETGGGHAPLDDNDATNGD